jgi:hypothetical protein
MFLKGRLHRSSPLGGSLGHDVDRAASLRPGFLAIFAGLKDVGGSLGYGFGSLSGGVGNGLDGDLLTGLRGLNNASGGGLSGRSLVVSGSLNGRLGRSCGRGFGSRLRRFGRGVVPAFGLGISSNLLGYLPGPVLRFAEKPHRVAPVLTGAGKPGVVQMASTVDRSQRQPGVSR